MRKRKAKTRDEPVVEIYDSKDKKLPVVNAPTREPSEEEKQRTAILISELSEMDQEILLTFKEKFNDDPLDFEELQSGINAKYTPEQKIAVCSAFVVTGNMKRASEYTGIPHDIIKSWKTRTSWWTYGVEWAKRQANIKLDHKITSLLDNMLWAIEEGVRGREVVDRDGNVVIEKPRLTELTTAFGTLYDKRALMRGDPTSRSEKITQSDQALQKIKEEFEKQLEKKVSLKIVDGDRVDEQKERNEVSRESGHRLENLSN